MWLASCQPTIARLKTSITKLTNTRPSRAALSALHAGLAHQPGDLVARDRLARADRRGVHPPLLPIALVVVPRWVPRIRSVSRSSSTARADRCPDLRSDYADADTPKVTQIGSTPKRSRF
jgi:hypothetical protein